MTASKTPRPLLSRDDIDALIRACGRRGSSGRRNAALLSLLATSGARIGEALEIVPANLQLNGGRRGELQIRTAKKRKGTLTERTRTVKLPESTLILIERWMEERRRLGIGRSKPLLCTISDVRVRKDRRLGRPAEGDLGRLRKKGGPLSAQYVNSLLARLGRKVGLPDGAAHPHGFRHAFACELERAGLPVSAISRLLGHSSLSTTSVYLSRFGDREFLDRAAAVFE